MKKLTDILDDYSLESVRNDFQNNLKLAENFGHLIAENSTASQINLDNSDFQVKYRGKINDRFHLSIRRFFHIQIHIKEEDSEDVLFERNLVLKGRYHLKNTGEGFVEILTSSPYSKFGNTIRKILQPEELSTLDSEFVDFSLEDFQKE